MKHSGFVSMLTIGTMLFMHTSCRNNNKEIANITTDTFVVTHPLRSDIEYEQEFVAEIQSLQNIEIRSRARGFIEKIHADEGMLVQQGQLLFTLSGKEYQDEILKASAGLKNAEAALKQIEVEIKNTELLVDRNVVSTSELDLLRAKKEATQAGMEEAKAQISLAKTNLAYTQIRAPFRGYVHRIPKKTGSLIEEGDLLTTLSNNTEMHVYFNLSEIDYLNYIKSPQQYKKVQLKLADGSIFKHSGSIETIDGEINVETGTIAFRARFPNPEKMLKHGASGKVLLSKPLSGMMLVPIKSTYEVQENLYVFVVNKNGQVEKRKIIPVVRLAKHYAVKEGVDSEDLILFDGVQLVKEGDIVKSILKPMKDLITD
jgi:membrane fusion protein (multidrug efflux system)